MGNFWLVVNRVIREADILIMVLDARMPNDTRNVEIENKVSESKKPLIYVLNKCDLVDKNFVEEYKKKIPNSVFMSAREHQGTIKLREKILISAARIKKSEVKVGILGYPNVGKSSVINALKGRSAAKTSSISGYTKGLQKIRIAGNIMLLDTPGVIPYQEADKFKHNIIGTIDHSKEKDPDIVAMMLMTEFPGLIEKHYGVVATKNKEKTLVLIAKKRNMIASGAEPDIMRTSRMILKDWQTGKITYKE